MWAVESRQLNARTASVRADSGDEKEQSEKQCNGDSGGELWVKVDSVRVAQLPNFGRHLLLIFTLIRRI